jgi:putative transposase
MGSTSLKEQFEATGKKLKLTTPQRRRLAVKARKLGWQNLMKYATLVRPETLLAWHRKYVARKYTAKQRIKSASQKRREIIQDLCVKFALENTGWGYGRIQGALANIGYKVCTTTVGNILRARGIGPCPDRQKETTWKQFIRSHMDVIAVADFFTTEVWTWRGLVRYHTFFVIRLDTRKVHIAHIGCQVNGQVMAQVARNLTDGISGVKTIQTRIGCPQQNGYAESFVASIKRECLNKMIFIGENSLRKAVSQYVEHYHSERNHQGLDNIILFPQSASIGGSEGLIVKNERLGGLLNYYHRIPDQEEPQEVQKAA